MKNGGITLRYLETNIDGLKLRETTKEDAGLILQFIKAIADYEKMSDDVFATEESIRESVFEDKRAEVLIIEFNGEAVGYSLYFFNYSTFMGRAGLYLEDIFINPEYRGKGIGKEVFKVLAKIAKENKCMRMEWCCLNWNTPSIEFYKGMEAIGMTEWTTYRLTADKIDKLID